MDIGIFGLVGIMLVAAGLIILILFFVSLLFGQRHAPVTYAPQSYQLYAPPPRESVKREKETGEIAAALRRHPVVLTIGALLLIIVFGKKMYRVVRQTFAFVRYAMNEEARTKIFKHD